MTCLCSGCKDMMAVPGHDLCRDCLDTAAEIFACADPEAAYIQMVAESSPPSGGEVFAFPGVHTRGEEQRNLSHSLGSAGGSPSVCMFGTSWCNERNPCPDCVEFASYPSGGEAA